MCIRDRSSGERTGKSPNRSACIPGFGLQNPQPSLTERSWEDRPEMCIRDRSYGYMLYSAVLESSSELNSLKLFKAADRAIAFIDKQLSLIHI